MTILITYILAVIGMVVITNKSVFFFPVRDFFAKRYNLNTTNLFFWFFHNLFSCGMCMSLWAGIICYLPIYFQYEFLLYPFIAVCAVTFSFKRYENL